MPIEKAMTLSGFQSQSALETELRAQFELRCVGDMGEGVGYTSNRHDGVHQDGRGRAMGIHIVPNAMRVVVFAAMDVHNGILNEMIGVERVGQKLSMHRVQLRFGVDVHIVLIRENGGIGHTDDFHVVGMDDVVGHVVFRAHAVELQRVVFRNKRDKLGGIAMDGQQLLMRGGGGIIAK